MRVVSRQRYITEALQQPHCLISTSSLLGIIYLRCYKLCLMSSTVAKGVPLALPKGTLIQRVYTSSFIRVCFLIYMHGTCVNFSKTVEPQTLFYVFNISMWVHSGNLTRIFSEIVINLLPTSYNIAKECECHCEK